jgi:vitamin B12 transporter
MSHPPGSSAAYRNTHSLLAAAALTAAASAGLAGDARAQTDPWREADAAYQACLPENADGRTPEEMKRAANEAERRFRELLRTGERTSDVQLAIAQVRVRCQIPHAAPMAILGIVQDVEREMNAVLATDPEHWGARFMLAMTLFNMPEMMGRAADAQREFERLLAQQGTRVEGPHFALPFLHLGDLHQRAGRTGRAVEIWRRGLALFPAHPALIARLANAGAAQEPDTSWLAGGRAVATGGDDATRIFALAPLRAEAGNHQLHEARGGTTLRRLDVYTMPGGTGEMLQALQALPGATRAGDGAELYIRGGDPAETPVFFDGGRLAFPGRWESLQGSAMGVVDASVLRRAYFSSGGFSARYGNALSGVVDVETEGRPAAASYRVGANMVQVGGSLRAPLSAAAGAWGTLSATDARLIARLNGEAELYTRSPQSVQGIGGVSWEPLAGVELRGSAISLGDRFARRVEMNGFAGDYAASSTMQHIALSGRALRPDGRRAITGSATASLRSGSMGIGVLDRQRNDAAFGARLEADAVVGAAVRVRAGAEAMALSAETTGRVPTTPSLAPGSPSLVLDAARERAGHAGVYVEAEHEPLPGLAVVLGGRADHLPGDDAVRFDPRMAAAFTRGAWTVRLGGGIFHQGSWRARYRLPDPGQPAGVPLRARHLVAGVERGGALSARLEGYLKAYDDYAPHGEGPAIRRGTNAGLDAIARWSPRSGPSGWLSYSLLRGRVGLEDGTTVPATLDVTHSLTAVSRVPVGVWELGVTGRYATGRPYTPVIGTTSGQDDARLPLYGAPNSARLPDHVRIDARVTRYLFARDRSAIMYLEMLNLLDRKNVAGYTWLDDYSRRAPIESFFAHRTFVLGVELQFN